MQATARLHDSVPNSALQEAQLIFHHAVPFHPANRVFDADADGRDRTIGHFVGWGEFTPARFLLGLDNGHANQHKALKAHLLIATTPRGQRVALKLCEALIRQLPFLRGAQTANATSFIEHQEVVARVALLFATVILVRFFRGFRTLDWAFSIIMPTRGAWTPPALGWGRAGRPTPRRYRPATGLGGLTPGAAPDASDESTEGHSIGTAQRVGLALLGWGSVAH